MRLDQLLVARGLARSRAQARALIDAGQVECDTGRGWERAAKPALAVADDAPLRVEAGALQRYVSRGGLKLEGALAHTGLSVQGWRCLDVGQSTGGFTDCLLQAGAVRVVGVEVGHGQLAATLRGEPRCACIEGCNARDLDAAALGVHWPDDGFDLIVCDASFISLQLLLPRWPALLAPAGQVLALVKPQFELGPAALGKGGIVRDAAQYAPMEARLRALCAQFGLTVLDFFDSCICGADGNREFFLHLRSGDRG